MAKPLINFDIEDAVRAAARAKIAQQLMLRCYRVVLAERCARVSEISDYQIQWKDLELVRQGLVNQVIEFPNLENYRFLTDERQIQVFDYESTEWMLIGDPHEAFLSIVPNLNFPPLNALGIEVNLKGYVKSIVYNSSSPFSISGNTISFCHLKNLNDRTVSSLDTIHDVVLKYLESRVGLNIFTAEHAIVQSYLDVQFEQGEITLSLKPLSEEENNLHLIYDQDTKSYGFVYKGITFDLMGNPVGLYNNNVIL